MTVVVGLLTDGDNPRVGLLVVIAVLVATAITATRSIHPGESARHRRPRDRSSL